MFTRRHTELHVNMLFIFVIHNRMKDESFPVKVAFNVHDLHGFNVFFTDQLLEDQVSQQYEKQFLLCTAVES